MKTHKLVMVSALLLSGTLAIPALTNAQGAFLAPPDAMDTLSGSSTGGGSNFYAIDRANNAVNAANNSNPFGDPAGNPFGNSAGGADPFGGPAGAGNPFGGPAVDPFGGPAPAAAVVSTAAIEPPTFEAWGGERIICHRTNQILQDAREIKIVVSAAGQYYDDGRSGNDAVADDNIYTNITVTNKFLSPEANVVKTKLIQTLDFVSPARQTAGATADLEREIQEDLQSLSTLKNFALREYISKPRVTKELRYFNHLDPMEFAGVRVATTEPLSPLPQLIKLEEEQDNKILDWGVRFLRDYRINPDQFDGEFYPTYLPIPPRAPNIPLPANFTPKPLPGGENASLSAINIQGLGNGVDPTLGGGAEGEGVFDGGVTGEPIGNASSRYF